MKFLNKYERVYLLMVLICLAFLVAGCGNVRPYVEVGAAYQLDGMSDYWVRTSRSWQCSNGIQGQLEVGVKYHVGNDHVRLGYHHESWLNCGQPFGNGRPEIYQDDVRLVYHAEF